jgi:hypothetical protein
MKMFWSLLNGQLEPGRSWAFWVPFAVLLFGSLILPTLLSRYALLNVNSFLLMAPLAAGLALLWGYGGVLSHGQSAFFGLGGYAYGIVAPNILALIVALHRHHDGTPDHRAKRRRRQRLKRPASLTRNSRLARTLRVQYRDG